MDLTLYWAADDLVPGDMEGDPIVNFDCTRFYFDELGMSEEDYYKDGLDNPVNRIIDNTWGTSVPYACKRIEDALRG
jgi:hypothetical protein